MCESIFKLKFQFSYLLLFILRTDYGLQVENQQLAWSVAWYIDDIPPDVYFLIWTIIVTHYHPIESIDGSDHVYTAGGLLKCHGLWGGLNSHWTFMQRRLELTFLDEFCIICKFTSSKVGTDIKTDSCIQCSWMKWSVDWLMNFANLLVSKVVQSDKLKRFMYNGSPPKNRQQETTSQRNFKTFLQQQKGER